MNTISASADDKRGIAPPTAHWVFDLCWSNSVVDPKAMNRRNLKLPFSMIKSFTERCLVTKSALLVASSGDVI